MAFVELDCGVSAQIIVPSCRALRDTTVYKL